MNAARPMIPAPRLWLHAHPDAPEIRALAPPREPWARRLDIDPMTLANRPGPLPSGRLIVWSGRPADEEGNALAAWGPGAWESLEKACQSLAPRLAQGGGRLLLRPHARHILSDVQRCLKLLLQFEGQPVGLALDAASMLEASMMGHAPDHLRRAFETLGPRCDAAWLSSVAFDAPPPPGLDDAEAWEDAEPISRLVELGKGLIDPGLLGSLLEFVPRETPIILSGPPEPQLRALGVDAGASLQS